MHAFIAICKSVLKSFDAELIDKVWICDLVQIQAKQAHTTAVVNIFRFYLLLKLT